MATKTVPKTIALDDAIAAALVPARPVRSHKGTFGKLLVIAGSVDYAGAALLVCNAAGRAGAGLVTLASVESLNQGGSLFANLQTAVRNMILIGVGVLQGLRTRRGAHLKGAT